MDEKRVADYFVVAGLPDDFLPLEEFSNEAAIKPSFKQDPITEIKVINRSIGEQVPKGYTCVERTPTGFTADLNHGSIRCPEMFLCYRRSRDKPPLTDIGVLYEGKERLMQGCEVVHTTPYGHPANVNNSNSTRIYITYRRASDAACSDTLAVVDICVILVNKNEEPPLAYNRINKTLNKGVMGSDVYLCYKKAMTKADVLAYKPAILGRYPPVDYDNFPLPESVPMFCLPMGATIECWSAKAQHPLPVFSTFVLTGSEGDRIYGAAVTFYEEYSEDKLSDLQMRHLGLKNKHIREQYRILKTVHSNKSICLLSHWPFFDAFKKFLSCLYKICITGPHDVPIERHISHFMYDVPYPSPQRPRILVQLKDDSISFCMPEDSPLPQSGASFISLLKNLGPENCMNMMLYLLLEHKILIHSLRPAVLTGVAEAVTNVMFPFHWQCPYIPLCPLGLSDVLNAPCPFIVGIDSRYFDLYDPPPDIICVDLDTNRVWLPEDKKTLNYKLLPKRPLRVLQETLHKLFNSLSDQSGQSHTTDEISLEMEAVDYNFKRKKKEMEMEFAIQEAFLHFMACMLKGYRGFLNPISGQPNLRATNASNLFDMQGFVKSRDKTNAKFFNQMIKTQMFIRFIEERSFVSENDASLAFFDECAEKVEENKEDLRLIEIDASHTSDRTVFIMPPEPVGLPEGVTYSYNGFPELRSELFLVKTPSSLSLPTKQSVCPNSPFARRTKQEIRSAQKLAQQQINTPERWAKCLLAHCYSLWFISLSAFVHHNTNKENALKTAKAVLDQMQEAELNPPDEICYRVLMQLCGQYNKPGLAIRVFGDMRKYGIQANAITYGFYNRVMLEAQWPSPNSKGRHKMWTKLRNMIVGVAQFRRNVRRRSVSMCSTSEGEYDKVSRTSVDSYMEDGVQKITSIKSETFLDDTTEPHISKANVEDRLSTGGASDRGYNSMTQEDVHCLSQFLSNVNQKEKSPTSSLEKRKKITGRSVSFHQKTQRQNIPNEKDGEVNENPSSLFRGRVGSIVRKMVQVESNTSNSEYETLKGVISKSAGLLMVSQGVLDNCVFRQGSMNMVENEKKRRRHKSAGDYWTKARSNSLLASLRPWLTGTGDESSIRFSDLVHKDGDDDIFEDGISDKAKTDSTDSGKKLENIKDSGVGLDENGHTFDTEECEEESSKNIFCANGSTKTGNRLSNISEKSSEGARSPTESLSSSIIKTPVTESDPLGYFMEEELKSSMEKSSSSPTKTSDSSNSFNSKRLFSSTPFASIDNVKNCDNYDTRSHTGSLDSTSVQNAPIKTLSDLGRTSSSPNCLLGAEKDVNTEKDSENLSNSTVMPQKQSSLSLDEPKERPTSFMLRRTQSLRRNTTEAMTGLFSYAAKTTTKAYKKFNEIKQSITTPVKNGSTASLARSMDDQDSGTGDDESASTVQDKRSFGGSQDLLSPSVSSEQCSDTLASQTSCGSVPSPSFLDRYVPYRDLADSSRKAPPLEKITSDLSEIAIEVEITSCSRCSKCHSLIYDEEIMAGWSADDSNLNTRCSFCPSKFVPNLQIYVKDWRSKKNTALLSNPINGNIIEISEIGVDGEELNNTSRTSSLSESQLLFGEDGTLEDKFKRSPSPTRKSPRRLTERLLSFHGGELKTESVSDSESLNLSEIALDARKRCTSECLTRATDDMSYSSSVESIDGINNRHLKSPLSISIDEDEELGSFGASFPGSKMDIMSRCISTIEPIVVPYLSPLVLRKELEHVLENEGDLCLSSDNFIADHPIIFWNLIWYFKRIGVPSQLTEFLLSSKSINKTQESSSGYTSANVLIRPLWDNTKIHDEIGLPMYISWDSVKSASMMDALITESQPFSRAVMHQIFSSIQCNDVLTPIKHVMHGRKRLRVKRHRFRSMYREVLFLVFKACGRENIDHDAFDREYKKAYKQLHHAELRQLQDNDKPRSDHVVWCRRVFNELEL
ncbi:C-myc promoter-binding protein isoform X3 [Patella vulgata]|nr:C-myc promoter-binding protein isoform X3 [Patella vulgata]XP_050402672.2 C-myc promoter-binding protein isoform X3 [Patella vulgata]